MSRKQLDRGGGDLGALGTDDSGCHILHLDMDAFFASVELLQRPELKGQPVIVGGGSDRGVVVSATYEARRFGIHAAMPMARARRLCPQAVVIPPSRNSYSAASRRVMEIIAARTDRVQQISIDEAFIDVRSSVRRLGSPASIAAGLRAEVEETLSLTCSIGVATTLFVAKLASTRAKPDGLLVVPRGEVLAFLHPMPVQALPGVGAKTQETLARYGISTVGELAQLSPNTLRHALGVHGIQLLRLAQGIDDREVTSGGQEKSIGAEETFEQDLFDGPPLRRELLGLVEKVATRLRRAAMTGRVVALKVRYEDFSTISRSRTLDQATDVSGEIYQVALELLAVAAKDPRRIRLLGVRAEQLLPASETSRQMLLGERELGRREAEQASDLARKRFGHDAIRPASLLKRPEAEPGK